MRIKLLLLWFVLLFAIPFVSFGAIGIDSTSNSGTSACYNTTSCSWNHTVSGSNVTLVVTVNTYASGASNPISSITYNSVAMTLSGFTSGGGGGGFYYGVAQYYLVNPSSGTNSIAISFASTNYGAGEAISLTGTDTANPQDATNGASGTSANSSVSITTSYNNSYIVDGLKTDGSDSGNATVGGGQTSIAMLKNANNNTNASSYKQLVSAGATTMTWTLSASALYSARAIAIKELVTVSARKLRGHGITR